MSLYPIGQVIRRYRKELRISQEKLSEGICSVATLSRIESGERLPNKANFDALMQRMGQSSIMYDAYISKLEFDLYELKFHIRQLISKEDFDNAAILLQQLEVLEPQIYENVLFKQFILHVRTLIEAKGELTMMSLAKLEDAIRLTLKNYGDTKIFNYLLTYEEIVILNNIACVHGENGDKRRAIQMLFQLKEYMEEKYINSEEKINIFPTIIYNLSKYLRLVGRFEECIELCNMGIEQLRKYGSMKYLALLLYNKAWCMVKIDDPNRDECKKNLIEAYYIEQFMGTEQRAEIIKKFALEIHRNLTEEYFL